MTFTSHTSFSPMATIPAQYTEHARCYKIKRLLETITPEHLALNKRDELLAILQRLQDMASGEAAVVCFFDDAKQERSPDIEPDNLHDSVDVFGGEEFSALFNGTEDDTSWYRVINIGYPLLTYGNYIQKFGMRIPIYITSDGIEAVAEIMFIPCRSNTPALLEFTNADDRFIDILEDFSEDPNDCVGDIDRQRKDYWSMMQHIDGSWFAIEPVESLTLEHATGRENDARSCILSTNRFHNDEWKIV